MDSTLNIPAGSVPDYSKHLGNQASVSALSDKKQWLQGYFQSPERQICQYSIQFKSPSDYSCQLQIIFST